MLTFVDISGHLLTLTDIVLQVKSRETLTDIVLTFVDISGHLLTLTDIVLQVKSRDIN